MIAMTREVSPGIQNCELSHLDREEIDPARAVAEHRRYEECLRELGCEVQRLPALPDHPDSVFVEDTAIVLDELAVITRPGTGSRRPETASVAEALRPYRKLAAIDPPGTLDGGDVLCMGKQIFVGLSARSSGSGIEQLRRITGTYGYTVTGVEIEGCLHLKSAATRISPETILLNPDWVPSGAFSGFDLLEVDPGEPSGANALWVGETVVYPAAYPRTRERLKDRGVAVCTLEAGELAKAEGGVTCCSLIFRP